MSTDSTPPVPVLSTSAPNLKRGDRFRKARRARRATSTAPNEQLAAANNGSGHINTIAHRSAHSSPTQSLTSLPSESSPRASPRMLSPPSPSYERCDDLDYLRCLITGQLADAFPYPATLGNYIAMDCEMIGVLDNHGEEYSSCARVSVVNWDGQILLDTFVRHRHSDVYDYRTHVSGVRREDVEGSRAMKFERVRELVAALLNDRWLVGHAVHNDLKCLHLTHPFEFTLDTQMSPSIAHAHSLHPGQLIGLRRLVGAEFGIDIQAGEHNSVRDARATMSVFRLYQHQWDNVPSYPSPPSSPYGCYSPPLFPHRASSPPKTYASQLMRSPGKGRKEERTLKPGNEYGLMSPPPSPARKGVSWKTPEGMPLTFAH